MRIDRFTNQLILKEYTKTKRIETSEVRLVCRYDEKSNQIKIGEITIINPNTTDFKEYITREIEQVYYILDMKKDAIEIEAEEKRIYNVIKDVYFDYMNRELRKDSVIVPEFVKICVVKIKRINYKLKYGDLFTAATKGNSTNESSIEKSLTQIENKMKSFDGKSPTKKALSKGVDGRLEELNKRLVPIEKKYNKLLKGGN